MSIKKILLLGAYSNFGHHIAETLINEPNIKFIFSGRSKLSHWFEGWGSDISY